MTLTVGSLFSGIGGLDLGFERAGFEVRWFCEADPFCQKVLAKHWPGVPCYSDVRALHAADVEPVDVLIGGFPCQDVSDAGKREGMTDDNRSGLWFEYARLIREFRARSDRPLRAVAIENVPGLFIRGFDRVLGDVAACGMDAEWQVIRASDVGAPHRRARVFVLAYAQPDAGRDEQQRIECWPTGDRQVTSEAGTRGLADAEHDGREQRRPAHDDDGHHAPWDDADGCDPATMADAASLREGEGREQPAGDHAARLRGASGVAQAPMAVSDSGGQREPDKQRHAVGLGAGVADAASLGQPAQLTRSDPTQTRPRGQWGDVAQANRPSGSGLKDGLADATSTGSQGHQPEASDGGIHGEHLRPAPRAATAWPARPGERQHPWEPPRCLESGVGRGADGVPRGMAGWRRAALQAFGNAVVPQVAEVVANRVREILE